MIKCIHKSVSDERKVILMKNIVVCRLLWLPRNHRCRSPWKCYLLPTNNSLCPIYMTYCIAHLPPQWWSHILICLRLLKHICVSELCHCMQTFMNQVKWHFNQIQQFHFKEVHIICNGGHFVYVSVCQTVKVFIWWSNAWHNACTPRQVHHVIGKSIMYFVLCVYLLQFISRHVSICISRWNKYYI